MIQAEVVADLVRGGPAQVVRREVAVRQRSVVDDDAILGRSRLARSREDGPGEQGLTAPGGGALWGRSRFSLATYIGDYRYLS